MAGTGAALVIGEAGIGKTRLARELADEARAEGALVLTGGCFAAEAGALPFAAFRQALRGLRSPEAAQLARVMAHGGEPAGRAPTGEPLVFDEALELFTGPLADHGLVLVLEDVHWADRATLDLAFFLLRNGNDRPLLLVLTLRDDEAEARSRVLSDLAFAENSVTIQVGGLDRVDARTLASRLAPAAPERVLEWAVRLAQGNPFYLTELMTTAQQDPSPSGLPFSLREAMATRLAGLPDDARTCLDALAVLSRPSDPDLLAAATDLSLERAELAVDACLDRSLLTAEGDEVVALRHALLGEALQRQITPRRRAAVAERIARCLARRLDPDAPDAADYGEVAEHWRAAGVVAEALPASLTAGRLAARASAWHEADLHLRAALALLDRPGGDDALTLPDRADLVLLAAEAARCIGDPQRAEGLLVANEQWLRETGSGTAVAIVERLARLRWHSGAQQLPPSVYEAAVAASEDEAGAARMLTSWAADQVVAGRLLEARDKAELGARLASRAGLVGTESRARVMLAICLVQGGDPTAGFAELDRSRELARRSDSPEDLLRVLGNTASLLDYAGDLAGAVGAVREALTFAGEHALLPTLAGRLAVNGTSALCRLGRWVEGREMLQPLVTMELAEAERAYVHRALAQFCIYEGSFGVARGHLDVAEAALQTNPDAYFIGDYWGLSAELSLWQGRAQDGLRAAESGLAAVGSSEEHVLVSWLLAIRARALGDLGKDRDPVVEPWLDLLPGDNAEVTAWVATATAELSRGRPGGILAWTEAAAAWERLAYPYALAYARWRLGEQLLARRHRGEAGAALAAAAAAARALGARPLLTAVEGLARAGHVVLPADEPAGASPAPDPSSADLVLTPRERQVLTRLAEGDTNRQVARALFISERTAGVHVSNILAKLGAASRTEAVAVALRRSLLAGPD